MFDTGNFPGLDDGGFADFPLHDDDGYGDIGDIGMGDGGGLDVVADDDFGGLFELGDGMPQGV